MLVQHLGSVDKDLHAVVILLHCDITCMHCKIIFLFADFLKMLVEVHLLEPLSSSSSVKESTVASLVCLVIPPPDSRGTLASTNFSLCRFVYFLLLVFALCR